MRPAAALLLVACGATPTAGPIDGPAPEEVLTLKRGDQLCVALAGDALAAGASNDRLRVWSSPDAAPLEVVAHRRGVTCVALAADGRLATGGPDRYVRAWHADGTLAWEDRGVSRPLAAVGFHGDRVVGVSMAGELITYGADGARELERPGPAQRGVMAVALSDDGARMAWAADGGNLRVWDTDTGAKVAGLRADGIGFVSAVALSPDGLVVTASRDYPRVAVWDPSRQVLLAECAGVDGRPRALAFAPDGVRLAVTTSTGALQVFDARTGRELERWSLGRLAARRVAFTDAYLAAAGPGSQLAWIDARDVAAPADVGPREPLDAPVLRLEDLARDAVFPEDGRLDIARLAVPDYDPPELRADAEPLRLGDLPLHVQVLAGKRITTAGYPLAAERTEDGLRFLLSRFPPGCCFGSEPVPDEWIDVSVSSRDLLDPGRRVEVSGVLEAGEVQDELGFVESLYRMRAVTVRLADESDSDGEDDPRP